MTMELENIAQQNETNNAKKEDSGFKKLYNSTKRYVIATAIGLAFGLYIGAKNPATVNNLVKDLGDLKNTIVGYEPALEKSLEQAIPFQEGSNQNGGK